MKVLKIAFGHPDNVFSLCSHLSEQVELTLVFVVYGDRYQQGVLNIQLDHKNYGLQTDNAFFKQVFPESIVRFVGDKYRVWVLKVPSLKLSNLKTLSLYWKAINRLKREKFDVVHYNGFSPYIYLFYQRLKADSRQFWTLHDYKNHSGEKNIKAELINRLLAQLKKLTVVQHYEYLREQVIKAFNLPRQKVQTLLSGPLDVFHVFNARYDACPNDDYILFFGRISRYKGVDVLLEAYTKMTSPKPQLVIAGKGDFWFDASPYISHPDIVFINKYVENEDLAGLIKKAQFIVIPYLDATHSAVIATAYAFNKPVVASNVDGLKEVVFDKVTGRLVPPNSADELRSAMDKLVQSPDELCTYVSNIKEEKQSGKIAWKNIIDAYTDLYAQRYTQS